MRSLSPHRGEAAMFLKFGMVGAAGFVVDAAVLAAGMALGWSPELARIVSIVVAMQATFALNDALVFRAHRGRPLGARWLGYMAANAFGAVCSYAVFTLLVSLAPAPLSQPFLALAIASGVSWSVNYTGSRLLAYRA